MTREHKLALLIGFALVMVVGIVVSDHFSGARSSQLGEVLGHEPQAEPDMFAAAADPRLGRQLPADQPPLEPEPGVAEQVASAVQNGAEQVSQFVIQMGAATPAAQLDAPDQALPPVVVAPRPAPGPEVAMAVPPAAEPMPSPAPTQRDDVVDRLAERQIAYPIHRVEPGDNLTKIARRYYGDGSLARKLQEFNKRRVAPDGTILVGASLFIPPREQLTGDAPVRTIAAAPERGSTRTEPPAAKPETAAAAKPRSYTVRKGDTLAVISQKQLGTTKRWREILAMNKDVIDDPDVLLVGAVLKIPAK